MRKFIVVTEEYTRGPSGEISVDLHEAETLDGLARELLNDLRDTWDIDDMKVAPWEYLKEANGEGMNYYLVKELLPGGTLGPSLLD